MTKPGILAGLSIFSGVGFDSIERRSNSRQAKVQPHCALLTESIAMIANLFRLLELSMIPRL